MRRILALTEDQIKKEPTDIVSNLIRTLLSRKEREPKERQENYNNFWLELTYKTVISNTIVLRLFAWEQVNEIIREAVANRPFARKYLIRGAGCEYVNGIYDSAFQVGEVPRYTKEVTIDNGNGIMVTKVLTLFRCSMRSKQKWWFISEADLKSPGTDKDIDYYQHKSLFDQEREPPCFGWNTVSGTSYQGPGRDPPPVLTRLEPFIPPGMTESNFLIIKLKNWAMEHHLLEHIFTASIHREVVSRTSKFLVLLAELNCLSADDIKLIWKAIMQNQETDVVEEILAIVCSLSPYLSDELFDIIIDQAIAVFTRISVSHINDDHTESLNKMFLFLEKFYAQDNTRSLRSSLLPYPLSKLLQLSWVAFQHPALESYKGWVNIELLLSLCLKEVKGSGNVLSFIQECTKTLNNLDLNSTTAFSYAARLVHILQYLLSFHSDAVTVETLHKEGLVPKYLEEELRRFVKMNRASRQQAASQGTEMKISEYKANLLARLQVLRHYYGLSPLVRMSTDMLRSLAELLTQTEDREPLFSFLRTASMKLPHGRTLDVAIEPNQYFEVFRDIICRADQDWTLCSEDELSCFEVYFSELTNNTSLYFIHHPNALDTRNSIGMDTLWKIAMTAQVPSTASNAIALLLRVYENSKVNDTNDIPDLLRRIFAYINQAMMDSYVSSAGDHLFDTSQERILSRCIEVLRSAISKLMTSSCMSHGVYGSMSRMKVTVRYRKLVPPSSYYSYTPPVMPGSSGSVVLDTHPMHTLLQLKENLANKCDVINPKLITLEKNGKTLLEDFQWLSNLDIVDGTELSATIMQSSNAFDEDDYAECRSDTLNSIGSLLIENMEYFDCLIKLAQLSHMNDELCKSVWDLLMFLPTQPQVLDSIRSLSVASEINWNSILDPDFIGKSIYRLQIVDSLLQPAPDLVAKQLESTLTFRKMFFASGGFSGVLSFFLAIPASETHTSRLGLSTALHTLHYCLFDFKRSYGELEDDVEEDVINNDGKTNNGMGSISSAYAISQFPDLTKHSSLLIEKLLAVAHSAATTASFGVVSDALTIVSGLMQSEEMAAQLISNNSSQSLFSAVLRSHSKKVREIGADFAITVGRSQSKVFHWLVSEFSSIESFLIPCDNILRVLSTLICIENTISVFDLTQLADVIFTKIEMIQHIYSTNDNITVGHRMMLTSCLKLLEILININYEIFSLETLKNLVNKLLSDFLFALPSVGLDKKPVCDHMDSRRAAFSVLLACLQRDTSFIPQILTQIKLLTQHASQLIGHSWGLSVSSDVKKSQIEYSGLKNQGCTCYMNALLQQLYMCVSFREAVLQTPLLECHRLSVWHIRNEDLVNRELLLEWQGGIWKKAKVLKYDKDLSVHVIEYLDLVNSNTSHHPQHHHTTNTNTEEELMTTATFNIREGRINKETGRVRIPPRNFKTLNISEKEEAAIRVLEQLQRAFCFMKLSKRRYFDTKPLVEACRTLNLNYNVYQQNDASEFFDSLLDRLESAMRGKFTSKDVWSDIMQSTIFGGKMLYQKIPTDCDYYINKRSDCGHWLGSRQESFLKVELIIRGKESIEDSLDELVKGELMDGDNKIMCDVCNEKKATIRRTCFGVLPNLLILHLKRFDLDFQTFETVKLNNRISFPTNINVFKYTKEGMDVEERRARRKDKEINKGLDDDMNSASRATTSGTQRGTRSKSISSAQDNDVSMDHDPEDDEGPDETDFEYKLQGVLVHAGAAQGGHYYSFIRDPKDVDKWYRFDDDDVTPFNPDQIAPNCFGGTISTTLHGISGVVEEDRSANALMLFFDKVKPIVITKETSAEPLEPQQNQSSTDTNKNVIKGSAAAVPVSYEVESDDTEPLVTGNEAFQPEVWEANRKHILSTYLLDPDIHNFVRGILTTANNAPDLIDEPILTETFMFELYFFLNVVLHTRDRVGILMWLNEFKRMFVSSPGTATSFLQLLLDPSTGHTWLKGFLFFCTDVLARSTFEQLLFLAVSVVAPTDAKRIERAYERNLSSLSTSTEDHEADHAAELVAMLIKIVMALLVYCLNHVRTSEEVFVLIKDIASIPSICSVLIKAEIVSKLCYFAIPDRVPENIRSSFPRNRSNNTPDFTPLLPSVYDALAAVIGVPPVQRANLLEERPGSGDYELTLDAKNALKTIFMECSQGGTMDAKDLANYFERIHTNTGTKVAQLQIRSILDRYETNAEGKLTLEGFLHRYMDSAIYQPKVVWQVCVLDMRNENRELLLTTNYYS